MKWKNMFFSDYGEGVNGNSYSEEYDFGDEYASTRSLKNTLFYYKPLFIKGEDFKKVYETDKAVLFEVNKGKFWVPKALLIGSEVHQCFERKYI